MKICERCVDLSFVLWLWWCRLPGRKRDVSSYGGTAAPAAAGGDDDDDDDIDLFGSDDEDAKAEREKRLAAYHEKKAKSE